MELPVPSINSSPLKNVRFSDSARLDEFFGYCQLKSHWADFLPRASNLNAEQSISYEFVSGLMFGHIHLP
jgi:hypothetical protein